MMKIIMVALSVFFVACATGTDFEKQLADVRAELQAAREAQQRLAKELLETKQAGGAEQAGSADTKEAVPAAVYQPLSSAAPPPPPPMLMSGDRLRPRTPPDVLIIGTKPAGCPRSHLWIAKNDTEFDVPVVLGGMAMRVITATGEPVVIPGVRTAVPSRTMAFACLPRLGTFAIGLEFYESVQGEPRRAVRYDVIRTYGFRPNNPDGQLLYFRNVLDYKR